MERRPAVSLRGKASGAKAESRQTNGRKLKTVIVGAGFTGLQLARFLSEGGAEVSLVENDPVRARVAREQVDCAVLEADGNDPATLAAAGIARADALVALTDGDEMNLITCALAEADFPDVLKIARVRNYAYYERTLPRPVFGIDCMVNPDVEAAEAICRAAAHGAVGNVLDLGGGRGVLELSVGAGSLLDGIALRDLPARAGRHLLVAWIEKQDRAVLPDGSASLSSGDRIGVVVRDPGEIASLAALAGEPPAESPRGVVVFGADLAGRLVAGKLLGSDGADLSGFMRRFGARRRRPSITVVDPSETLCREASTSLPGARVLRGDFTDDAFLRDEALDSCDLAVFASPDRAANLVMAAYLKSRGAKRTIALAESAAFGGVARKLGVDVSVPLRDTVVDSISGRLRGRRVRSVHSVCNRSLEIVEFDLSSGVPAAGKPLRDLSVPGEYLMLLFRAPGAESFDVPTGDTVVLPGSGAVVAASAGSQRVAKLFGWGPGASA